MTEFTREGPEIFYEHHKARLGVNVFNFQVTEIHRHVLKGPVVKMT